MVPSMEKLVNSIADRAAGELAALPMMCRTHGQPATPSTMGKEWANTAYRLARQVQRTKQVQLLGKFSGAVGNFNAHAAAYAGVAWPQVAKTFVEQQLGLT